LRNAVDFRPGIEALPDSLKQDIEVAIAGRQDYRVATLCFLEDVQRNADVPIAFCGAIETL